MQRDREAEDRHQKALRKLIRTLKKAKLLIKPKRKK